MGSEENEIKEVTILGRTVRWTAEGLENEADAGHRRRIMEVEGLEEYSKAVPSPAVKEGGIGRRGLGHGRALKISK